MRDRSSVLAPMAAGIGVFGVCCGLSALLPLSVLGAVAGVSWQSWGLIGLGFALALLAGARWAQRRRAAGACCAVGGPNAGAAPHPERTAHSSTKGLST